MKLTIGFSSRFLGAWISCVPLALAAVASASAQQPPRNFVSHDAPRPIPAIQFTDDQGHARTLANFRGKVVLLNIWTTWCTPCRREMPSLDRLQGILGGSDFEVVALSMDRSGIEVVRKFYAEVGIRNLAIYNDRSSKAARELGTVGVPATLLIDRESQELGRIVGPAEWDEPDIVEFLRRTVSQKTGATPPTSHSNQADMQDRQGSELLEKR